MGLFSFLKPLQDAIEQFIIKAGLTIPPWAGIFVVFVTLFISSISGFLNRKLIDLETLQEKSEEMKKHQADKKKAKSTPEQAAIILF